MMKLLVLKFGGSVLRTIDDFSKIAKLIAERKKQDHYLCIVVSAMYKATDQLLNSAYHLSSSPQLRELDALATTGEQVSASLLAIALNQLQIPAISLSAQQAKIFSDSNFCNGSILKVNPTYLKNLIYEEKKIPIIVGFQGINRSKEIVSLGRGGSDYTAVKIAAALGAEAVEFYKDVTGIFCPSSKLYNQAFPYLSYSEAVSIIQKSTHQVIYEKAIACAEEYQIKLRISSLRGMLDASEGTLISNETRPLTIKSYV